MTYGVSPLFGTLAGIALSLVSALALSFVTLRLRGHYLALATLAFGLLVDSLTVGMTDTTGGPSGLAGIPSFAVSGFTFSTPLSMYYLVAGIIVVLVLLLLGGMRSSFGRALKTVRTDQIAAAALGVNVVRIKLAAVLISAALGSLSGSLYAFYFHFLSPEMVGTPRSFEMIAMLVAGGEGTLIGPILGVALLDPAAHRLPALRALQDLRRGRAAGDLLPLAARRHVRRLGRAGDAAVRRKKPGGAMTEPALRNRQPVQEIRRREGDFRREPRRAPGQPHRRDRP